jgi:hypothetical protein
MPDRHHPPDKKSAPGHDTGGADFSKTESPSTPLISTDSTSGDRQEPQLEQLGFEFDSERELTTAERFEQFHASNPHVYRHLVRLARLWVGTTGRHKLGIGQLWERLRWDLAIETGDVDYALNNIYRAFYARLIMAQEPDLIDLFETRRSAADAWIGKAAA